MRRESQTTPKTCDRLLTRAGVRLLLASALTFGACKVGPNFTRPTASVNQSWSATGDPRLKAPAATDGLWWKVFQDPVLERLIELSYQQNLSLQVAGLRIVEARAMLGIATGKQYPQTQALLGGVSAAGLPKSLASGLGFKRNFANYQLGFDAVWELDFWGKYRRGVESEAANLVSTVADYQAALVSLAGEVARIYTEIRTYEVRIALAEENARLQEAGLKIAESRFHNGATSELDVTQATALLESTRASIPQLQIALHQARNALSTLLGQTTGSVVELLAGPTQIPQAPEGVAIGVPAEMLRRRPDIRGAEWLAAAQCARIGVARSELYPSFSLSGVFGLWGNTTGRGSHNLFSANSGFYLVGPRLSWPILNYGRLMNAVRVEDARFQQTLVSYRNTVLKAAQEVEDALTGFLHSQDATAFQERSVFSAQRSQDIAVVQYREGAVDYQRVLDAQRFLLQQQNALAQLRSTVTTSLIALYKALGGGWELRKGQSILTEQAQKEMQQRTHWGDLLSEPRAPEAKANPSSNQQ